MVYVPEIIVSLPFVLMQLLGINQRSIDSTNNSKADSKTMDIFCENITHSKRYMSKGRQPYEIHVRIIVEDVSRLKYCVKLWGDN